MKSNTVKILRLILRILIGAFFITTAIFKLLSIDNFELYIYSFNLFSYNLCAVLARAIISAEMLLGFLLIAKILYKPAWWTTIAMLIGFTGLLVYVAIFRKDANCHCMGDIVQLNPTISIIKNLVTIGLMQFIRKEEDYTFKGKIAVGICGASLAILSPFILFPTNSIYNIILTQDQLVDVKKFELFMQDSIAQSLDIDQGNYIVGVVAAGCQYCKMGSKKINAFVEKNHLNPQKVVILIWGNESTIQDYKEETGAKDFRYATISPIDAISLVNGKFPTFLFVKDEKITEVANNHNLDEMTIAHHLE